MVQVRACAARARFSRRGDRFWLLGYTLLFLGPSLILFTVELLVVGCAWLALLPLVRSSAIRSEGIVIDAKSGVSGAGRGGGGGFGFSEVNENVQAYGVPRHNHIAEIEQELSHLARTTVQVVFTPHLIPMTRGILATVCPACAGLERSRGAWPVRNGLLRCALYPRTAGELTTDQGNAGFKLL